MDWGGKTQTLAAEGEGKLQVELLSSFLLRQDSKLWGSLATVSVLEKSSGYV